MNKLHFLLAFALARPLLRSADAQSDSPNPIQCERLCTEDLGISCDRFLQEYILQGSCCSLKKLTDYQSGYDLGCRVQVGFGNCYWYPKCEDCSFNEYDGTIIPCNAEYQGAEGFECPASEYPTDWSNGTVEGPWNDYKCPPVAAPNVFFKPTSPPFFVPFVPTSPPFPDGTNRVEGSSFEFSNDVTIFIVNICVLVVVAVGVMYYCAFRKNSGYDPQQASQTRRRDEAPPQPVAFHTSRNAANTQPPPPDPRRAEMFAVNLYYGTVTSANEMGMRHLSSSRFTKQVTTFEPRQPNPEDECPICCDNFLPGQEYVISKVCNHVYHKRCIEEWTIKEQKDDCPVCRRTLLPSGSDLPPPILPPNPDDVEA